MQCANCQFENMPGNARCVRCGGAMLLAAAAISIDPPRAAHWKKTLRGLIPRRKLPTAANDWLSANLWAGSRRIDYGLSIGCILRMTIPGWLLANRGHRLAGRCFFAAWLLLLCAALACFGSAASAMLVGLAIAVHLSSVLTVVSTVLEFEVGQRILIGSLGVVLGLAVYFSALRSMSHFVLARSWASIGAPLAPGDVALFDPRAYRHSAAVVGDVVLYRPQNSTRLRPGHTNFIYQIQGEIVDRILAGPNSEVHWHDGQLWVDGQRSDLQPLNPERLPAELKLVVPAGSYCILPTTVPLAPRLATLGEEFNQQIWREQSIIPAGNVLGRAVVRNYPWSRWWWIR